LEEQGPQNEGSMENSFADIPCGLEQKLFILAEIEFGELFSPND